MRISLFMLKTYILHLGDVSVNHNVQVFENRVEKDELLEKDLLLMQMQTGA